jgi:hypothetical protein
VQILIFWNPDAKFHHALVEGWRPQIDSEFSPHFGTPISCFTVTMKVMNSTEPAIAGRRRVETQVLAGRSFDDPASGGKFGMNDAVIIPGRFSPATKLFVSDKKRLGNKWRNRPVADRSSPSITRRPDLVD